MQNLDWFYTTSDFDREYLRNETRYQKSKRHVISSDSARVQPNKSGELWSTIHKVVHVSLDPPKSTFSTDYISTHRVCWLLKFLHALQFDQAFVAHIAIEVWGPLKNFKGQHLKLGLKFHTWAPIRRNKICVLWSTNQNVIDAHVDPPNWTFFGRLYFDP